METVLLLLVAGGGFQEPLAADGVEEEGQGQEDENCPEVGVGELEQLVPGTAIGEIFESGLNVESFDQTLVE
ncbi:MAG: hypothetical protein Q8O06_08690, partial [Acetobacterium sp.]|nr:hypothetical protein [Acetobacterium sp.]